MAQLRMRRENLENLPEVVPPEGYEIRSYREGDEAAWAEIINNSFGGSGRNAETTRRELTGRPEFMPDGLYFATYRGKPVGTACAWRQSPEETKVGYVHMVGVMSHHQGHGLGYWVSLAVLHYFRDHGFTETILDTDDWRVPALKTYLKLGFTPLYRDESQRHRWAVIFSKFEEYDRLSIVFNRDDDPKSIRESRGNLALLLLVDSSASEEYETARRAIITALNHFGMPYRVFDISNGHTRQHLLQEEYSATVIAQEGVAKKISPSLSENLVSLVRSGLGFVSFDYKVDEYPANLKSLLPILRVKGRDTCDGVSITSNPHFITRDMALISHTFWQSTPCCRVSVEDSDAVLAETSNGNPALVISQFNADDSHAVSTAWKRSKVAQFLISPKVWLSEYFGHCEGLDALLWKSIVWAAKKPFVTMSMPPYVTARIDDCVGERNNFEYIDILNRFGYIPNIGVFTEELYHENWHRMSELTNDGKAEFSPHALTDRKLIYYRFGTEEYSDEELEDYMTRVKNQFDKFSVPMSNTVNIHFGDFGRNSLPHILDWDGRYFMNQFLPNEAFGDEHLNWHPAPYGHFGFILDNPFAYPQFFVATSMYNSASEQIWVDSKRTRYRIGRRYLDKVDFLWGLPAAMLAAQAGRTIHHGSENRLEDAAQSAVRQIKLGLENGFFGVLLTHEYMLRRLNTEELEWLLERINELTACYKKIYVGYDHIAEYGKSKTNSTIALAHYDFENRRFRCVLKGEASVPLQMQIYTETDGDILQSVHPFQPYKDRIEEVWSF